jgi:predicted transcriptional regulator
MAHELTERLFGGSVKSLVLSLVKNDEITPDDLAELRSAISSLESSS